MNNRLEYYTRERYGMMDRLPANDVAEVFIGLQGGKVFRQATLDAARKLGYTVVAVPRPTASTHGEVMPRPSTGYQS